MKRLIVWVFSAVIGISALSELSACKKVSVSNDNEVAGKVEAIELIRTSQSWDGVELPDYLQGRPELVAVHYEIPPGKKLGWHLHIGR